MIGASPDGLNGDGDIILEVKCPIVLEEIHPGMIQQLTPNQRKNYCLTINSQNQFELKKSHAYYYQVQCQLFVTGRKLAHFIVQSPLGCIIVPVLYDHDFAIEIAENVKKNYVSEFVPEFIEQRVPRKLKRFTMQQ